MVWNNPFFAQKTLFKPLISASLIAATLLVVGCASKPMVNNNRVYYVPEFYTVQPGDSLSKIANKYGLNYIEVARLNNIQAVDKIYVNQSLRLRGAGRADSRLVRTTPISQPAEIKRQNIAQQAQTASVPSTPNIVQPNNSQVGLSSTINPIPSNNLSSSATQLKWVRPSNGQIIGRFDLNSDRKGIQYSGNIGDSIVAAAAGEIVYADDGLKEYGKLILIRHTNGYITAYAHNNRLLVKVGDKVTAGQKIAEMGNTGTSRTMLEFQVRLDGKPIDPFTVLP